MKEGEILWMEGILRITIRCRRPVEGGTRVQNGWHGAEQRKAMPWMNHIREVSRIRSGILWNQNARLDDDDHIDGRPPCWNPSSSHIRFTRRASHFFTPIARPIHNAPPSRLRQSMADTRAHIFSCNLGFCTHCTLQLPSLCWIGHLKSRFWWNGKDRVFLWRGYCD